jgi:hypothetical protein
MHGRIKIIVLMDTAPSRVRETAVENFKAAGFFVEIDDVFIDNTNLINPYDWTCYADYYLAAK